jgi:hypothetical protein
VRSTRSQRTRALWGNEAAQANERWARMTDLQKAEALRPKGRDINHTCDGCDFEFADHGFVSRLNCPGTVLLRCPPHDDEEQA